MGKRQHQKDKMYLTTTEWSSLYGGYKASSHTGSNAAFRRLPLTHCTLSLQPFNFPYCDTDGNIFELEAVLPFLRKFKVNPINGKPFLEKNLIKLEFHKSSTGEYHCPVLYKPLTNSSHVVAVKTTGNVFCYEAVDQLNITTNNWRDLLTDKVFTRADLIVLQEPGNLDKFNIAKFHHIVKELKIEDEELVKARTSSSHRLKNVTRDTQMILDEFNESYKEAESKASKDEATLDRYNAAHYSSGKVSSSFTSTSVDVATQNTAAVLEDDTVKYARVKKKGYVALKTNHGTLNLELYCDVVTRACDNFIQHCDNGYYNGTVFHRSIRHFMLQGGDPTGTGNGGQSIWKEPFKDEFRQNLSHKGRGILSMANSGPDQNKSQFFITYRSCPHLDAKHTIFGRVVGGLNALSAIEAIETDNKDRPIEDVVLLEATVFVNPFKEAVEQLAEERRVDLEKKQQEEDELKSRKRPLPKETKQKVFRDGVGKFLDLEKTKVSKEELQQLEKDRPRKKKVYTNFTNFTEF